MIFEASVGRIILRRHNVGFHYQQRVAVGKGKRQQLPAGVGGIGGRAAGGHQVAGGVCFGGGLVGSGSWCFVGHQSAREDCIEIVGEQGMLSFSVFNYKPIRLVTSEGLTEIEVKNPPYVQLPIIRQVIEDLQGLNICTSTSVSATPTNWVMDRILGKM